jgi:hypothetical protein
LSHGHKKKLKELPLKLTFAATYSLLHHPLETLSSPLDTRIFAQSGNSSLLGEHPLQLVDLLRVGRHLFKCRTGGWKGKAQNGMVCQRVAEKGSTDDQRVSGTVRPSQRGDYFGREGDATVWGAYRIRAISGSR